MHLIDQISLKKGQIKLDRWKEQAIKKLNNEKAPGADGVCPEMLKAEEQVTPESIRKIFQSIWESESIPNEWRTGLICENTKEKGNLADFNNSRGITLLSLTCKVFRSCYIDHIFVLRQILEQTQEWNTSLYVVFVDFKAFDSLHRDLLWKILRHYGIPAKIVNIIQSLLHVLKLRDWNKGNRTI